jgi:hypothetical protein
MLPVASKPASRASGGVFEAPGVKLPPSMSR